MEKEKSRLRLKNIPVAIDNVDNVSVPDMRAFFDSLQKLIDGSYRRIQMDFTAKSGQLFTATFYRCGSGAVNSWRFYRIDVKKTDS